jgi:hypothetical protein
MNRKKRLAWLLIPIFLSLAGLVYLVFTFPPNWKFEIGSWKLEILYVFFLLFFVFLLSSISYFLRSPRRALLIGLLTLIYFVLRIFRLDSPYFLLLIVALYISLELFFKRDQ